MGTIAQKISYTKTWVDDIELALQERGIDTTSLSLEHYGEAIRSIQSGGGDSRLLADYDRINSFKITSYKNFELEDIHDKYNRYDDDFTYPIVINDYNNTSIDIIFPAEALSDTIEENNYSGNEIYDLTEYTIEDILK